MGVWELETGIAVLLFLLAAPVLLLPAVHHLYRAYGRLAGWPAAILGLGGLYALALVAFTQFPIPADSAQACRRTTGGWRPRPFASFVDSAETAREVGLAAYLTSASFLQEAMNVVLLVPFGFLIGLRTKLPWWAAMLAGLGVSLTIELTQGTGVWGAYDCPYRLAEFDDLVTNTLGATIGWGIGRSGRRWVPWPERRPVAEGPPPVARRVLGAACDLVAIVLVGIAFQVAAAVAVRGLTGEVDPAEWPRVWPWLLGTLLPVLVVAVLAPLARADRATVGQWAVLVRPVDRTGDPPGARRLGIRAAVRWAPLCLAGLTAFGPVILLAGAAIQLGIVLGRADRASLAAIGSGVRTTGAACRGSTGMVS